MNRDEGCPVPIIIGIGGGMRDEGCGMRDAPIAIGGGMKGANSSKPYTLLPTPYTLLRDEG